ncbi:thiol:disulfide interchange protein DsbD [Thiohalospira halophila DSM 15071]|uniref:Thiol:disulfide interchange protein DsbD n=1 Tax=Thiohalospira halophila DSM 15071 TaxID=1123397 RepID=A0A1I1VH18_9GAMM|nr:protein-disulfide reductase DsbD [Thiohalospira halophila]SFD82301.1 thiol:disulfide interchange protein DsbD [Thiohalospira halophila DSM 15071]
MIRMLMLALAALLTAAPAAAQNLLDPDDAFAVEAEAVDGQTIRLNWEVHPDYYLYQDKFELESTTDGVSFGGLDLPEPKVKQDEFFGEVKTYSGSFSATVPVERSGEGAKTVAFTLHSQGCNDPRGVCYPPHEQPLEVDLPEVGAGGGAEAAQAAGDSEAASTGTVSEQNQLADSLANQSVWLTVLTFFGLGLLLAFTPCVFPMIPILSSIIAGQGENITTKRAFTMSVVYVLAMALTYTAAGVIAGLFGENLQAAFQNPWILGTFATIFVLLALSMFGFYDLQLPSSVQGKLSEVSNRQEGGTLTGVGIMGFLSALIVGPCVAAPLMGALIYIGQTGDAVLGGLALFALSLGMGAPLVAIGTGAGKLMPKAGPWMDAVKGVFGILLLAVAIWMLERVLPGQVTLGLWAILFMVSAVYMGALDALAEGVSGWRRFWKGLGLVLLIYGVFMLAGAATGGSDPLRPLQTVSVAGGGGSAEEEHLEFRRVGTVEELNSAVEQAAANDRPVMFDFYADWCVSCKEFEKYTFSDSEVQSTLAENNVLLLQADVTDNTAEDKALLREFDLIGPPAILFFDREGDEKSRQRVVGFMEAEPFNQRLQQVYAR